MSTFIEDPLYQYFAELLHSGLYDETPAEIFVGSVVEAYWQNITSVGHVPQRLQETLRLDFTQDVQEMLKAKIYGHHNIGEYNRTRRQKQNL